jgi:hypothetical protein
MSSKKSKKRRARESASAMGRAATLSSRSSAGGIAATVAPALAPEPLGWSPRQSTALAWVTRVLAADSVLWVALLLTLPVLVIGLELTVGPRLNEWPLVDADFWWHLTTGDWILDHHRIPTTDPFSWTHAGQTWIAHEWLAEVLLALTYRVGGFAAAIVLTWAVAVLGFWRLITGAGYYGLSRRAAAVAMVLFSSDFVRPQVIAARPQVWTWTLLAILMAELAAYDTGRRTNLWLLPPLFILWVNLNLTALIGIGCLGAFVLDRLIRRPIDRHVVTVGAVSALALLINPYHVKLPALALRYLEPHAVRRRYILEWMRPNMHERGHLGFGIALVLTLPAIWFLARRRPRFWPCAPLLVLAYQSYQSLRYIPVFLLIAFIFLGWLLGQNWRPTGATRSESKPIFPKRVWAFALPVAATALTLALALEVKPSQFRRDPLIGFSPESATSFYLVNYPGTKIFNTYDFGGYLIHRFAGSDNKVFIDGREEMYGDTLVRTYFDVVLGSPGWQNYFDDQGIQAVIIRKSDGLAHEMQSDSDWALVYLDDFNCIFVRASIAHEPIR